MSTATLPPDIKSAQRPSTCHFTDEDVFNYSLELLEGHSNPEMEHHLEKCSKCAQSLIRFRSVEKVVGMMKAESAPKLCETVSGATIPTAIGDFKILNLIAEGGMGKVWKPSKIDICVANCNSTIEVVFGDLFEQDGIRVIAVNEFFDSELGKPVSDKSVH